MGGAVNENDFATWIILVFGTIALGDCGVFEVVAAPVKIVAVPVGATVENGSWNVSVDEAVSVLDI